MRPSIIVSVAVFSLAGCDSQPLGELTHPAVRHVSYSAAQPNSYPGLPSSQQPSNSCASETWTACIGLPAKPYHPTEFDKHRYASDGLIGY